MSWAHDAPRRRRGRERACARRGLEDVDAFHDFYVANADRVAWFFRRRTLDPEVALDLTADTFAIALQQRRQFRGATEAEAAGWLFAIARSRLASYWRRGSAERRALALLGADRPPSAGLGELELVDERAARLDLRRELAEAVADLNPDQAYAIEQRVVCERGYGELAEELGVSQDVVRARVSRGLRALALIV